jgi:tRNA threonylcarbamoyladenosine biosynthesis protein TsaB
LGSGGAVLDSKADYEKNSHARKLTVLVDELLRSNHTTYEQLDAIAVSAGPGSYTGLRIGVSATKGYCYALNKPIVAVPTLQLVAAAIKQQSEKDNAYYLPLIDARRMDVYAALYSSSGAEVLPAGFFTLNESFISMLSKYEAIIVGGDAAEKSKAVLIDSRFSFAHGIIPHASNMAAIAESKFNRNELADVAYFEPMYINQFQPKLPKAK